MDMDSLQTPIEHASNAARRAFSRTPMASPAAAPSAAASVWPFVAGLAVGALCMYMSDPVSGRRRRSTTKQSAARLGRIDAMRPAKKRFKDLSNRAQGLKHSLMSAEEGDVSDERLERRVRTALGRLSQAPSDIAVQVTNGHVELTGHVGRMEQRAVVHGVKQVRGTRAVTNRMEAYDETAAGRPSGAHETDSPKTD